MHIEGENIVMLLQVARQLVKARDYRSAESNPLLNNVDAISPEYLINLFEAAAKTQIYNCVNLCRTKTENRSARRSLEQHFLELCKSPEDGNVYAALLDWAQKSPLNQHELTTAYTKHLKPMMEEARSNFKHEN
uniref:Acyl-CoA oxidase C-terminal domain-containing protein n=1 Tax=Ditylenchus dipsaci TaxID=166011 RepID=A0A915D5J1_9BILA